MDINTSEQITNITNKVSTLSKQAGILRAMDIVMAEDSKHREMSKDSLISLILLQLRIEYDKIGKGE